MVVCQALFQCEFCVTSLQLGRLDKAFLNVPIRADRSGCCRKWCATSTFCSNVGSPQILLTDVSNGFAEMGSNGGVWMSHPPVTKASLTSACLLSRLSGLRVSPLMVMCPTKAFCVTRSTHATRKMSVPSRMMPACGFMSAAIPPKSPSRPLPVIKKCSNISSSPFTLKLSSTMGDSSVAMM